MGSAPLMLGDYVAKIRSFAFLFFSSQNSRVDIRASFPRGEAQLYRANATNLISRINDTRRLRAGLPCFRICFKRQEYPILEKDYNFVTIKNLF
jgi:hypothetical protein